jgi:Restriction endonuclease S subunits
MKLGKDWEVLAMSFDEQNELTLAQAIESANTGLDAIKRAPIVSYNSGTRCLRIQDISQSKEFENWGFCEVETKNYDKFCLKKGDIMVARTGATIGVNFLIRENLKAVYNNGLIRLRINNQVADYTYIYYNLRCNNYWGHIEAISGGTSTQPNMRINALLDYKILVPPIPQQKAIASILSALDEKIELNNRINKNLEEMAQAIFKSWFVDFEPFQDGEFEDSELGRIPKGWRVGYLGEIIELYDSKRIPLSSRQREGLDKKYPYYGATSIMDYVDKYIFDGIYLLLGEDGSVIDENEYPFLQYVWGKFWVNNHAHVIKGKNGFSEEYLFTLLKKQM